MRINIWHLGGVCNTLEDLLWALWPMTSIGDLCWSQAVRLPLQPASECTLAVHSPLSALDCGGQKARQGCRALQGQWQGPGSRAYGSLQVVSRPRAPFRYSSTASLALASSSTPRCPFSFLSLPFGLGCSPSPSYIGVLPLLWGMNCASSSTSQHSLHIQCSCYWWTSFVFSWYLQIIKMIPT